MIKNKIPEGKPKMIITFDKVINFSLILNSIFFTFYIIATLLGWVSDGNISLTSLFLVCSLSILSVSDDFHSK